MPSPIILIVTRRGEITVPVMEYTVTLAKRLHCRLLVAYVNTLPYLRDSKKGEQSYLEALKKNVSEYRKLAAAKDVGFDYIRESGKIGKVINRLCHIVKRIDFIVVDKGVKLEETVSKIAVPVFNIDHGSLTNSVQGTGYDPGLFLTRVTAH